MKKEKKIKEKIKQKIIKIISVSPKRKGDTGYLKLTDEEIDKIVDLFDKIYQQGFKAGKQEHKKKIKEMMYTNDEPLIYLENGKIKIRK